MDSDARLNAGEDALASGDWRRARDEFAAAVLDEPRRGRALLGLGRALWWLGDTRGSIDFCRRAFGCLRRDGELELAAEAAIDLCLIYKADLGNHAAASGWIGRAERIVAGREGSLQGWLWLIRGYAESDLARARQLAHRSIEASRADGDLDLELCAMSELGYCLVAAGEQEEGFAYIDEAMAGVQGHEATQPTTGVFVCCQMLLACDEAGDLQRATEWCRLIDAVDAYGSPYLYACCRVFYGSVLLANGRWQEAERELTTALRTSREHSPAVHMKALVRMADLRLRQGRLEEADHFVVQCEGHPEAVPVAAELLLLGGHASSAIHLLEARLRARTDPAAAVGRMLQSLTLSRLAVHDVRGAAAASKQLTRMAAESGDQQLAARAAYAGGAVAAAGGDETEAVTRFLEARERFTEIHRPWEAAHAGLEAARSLAHQQPELAASTARLGMSTFEALGDRHGADVAAALLRSLGVRGRTGPRSGAILSNREQEVLSLVAEGLSNPEIAERLVISRKTASRHVSHILEKIGARNRAEAASRAATLLQAPKAPDDYVAPGTAPAGRAESS